MDVQTQPQLTDPSGYIGIALSDLGAHIEALQSKGATGGAEGFTSSREDLPSTPNELVERVGALLEQMGVSGALGVGVAVWDQANSALGEITDVRYGSAWAGFPFANRLAAHLGAPVRLASGVDAAARAEAALGAGAGRSPLLYVHLGRSVASALVVDGEPLIGAHHDAGRLHHWQTGLDGPRCVCGAQGHLGPLVSAQSLVRLAIGAASHDDETLAAIHRVTHGRAEALTAAQVVTLASEGTKPLRELMDYAAAALAAALANLTVTLDPAVIVIGGALARADDVFFAWLRERTAERLTGVGATPDIIGASLGTRGAVIGASVLARG